MSMFNFVSGFLVGVYSGLYAAKHYNVPDVPEPNDIVQQVKSFLDMHKKDRNYVNYKYRTNKD